MEAEARLERKAVITLRQVLEAEKKRFTLYFLSLREPSVGCFLLRFGEEIGY